MLDWLRFLLMTFYAPVRGMRGMRDRGSLAPVVLIAFVGQFAFGFVAKQFAGAGYGVVWELFHTAKVIAIVAIVLVPILTLVANMFDRRGSFRVVLTQEYAPLAASLFYVLTAANLIGLLITVVLHYSGVQDQTVAMLLQAYRGPEAPEFTRTGPMADQFQNPIFLAYSVFVMFKRTLESASLYPADVSAHFILGLIHQSRGELDQARVRFERALQIDAEEIDAYYQLGRIARQQKRYADAIQNFEQVVARNPAHSQHEIWREVAATYIAAGQFEDARTALEQFLEHRTTDPEGLYLMGRAHAGLGHKREATSLMQACIEAVKTAPAYKYRSSKRWLNEAQQFIKSSQ